MRVLDADMDIETFDPALVVVTEAEAGRALGCTGMTWGGASRRCATTTCTSNSKYAGTNLSTYPFLVEAYLRDYEDPVLAVAGGYYFGLPGQTIRLDGSRSLARPGRAIAESTCRLHDGREVHGPVAEVRYYRPGLYSETLGRPHRRRGRGPGPRPGADLRP